MSAPVIVGARPDRLDLDIRAGEPVDFTVPVLDENGAAVTSLAGWSAAAHVRAGAAGPLLYAFTALVDGVTVNVTAPGVDTGAWPWLVGQWDLVLTGPGGVPHVLCAGWVRVYPTITHN